MQRSKCKNANPKKVETRGFSRCPNPGFGFGKMSGLPRYPGFSKPGFQSLMCRWGKCKRQSLIMKFLSSSWVVRSGSFAHVDCSAAHVQVAAADVGGADCCWWSAQRVGSRRHHRYLYWQRWQYCCHDNPVSQDKYLWKSSFKSVVVTFEMKDWLMSAQG